MAKTCREKHSVLLGEKVISYLQAVHFENITNFPSEVFHDLK